MTYVKVIEKSTDKQKNEKEQETENEPTINDLMKMLCQFQIEIKDNFNQLFSGWKTGEI